MNKKSQIGVVLAIIIFILIVGGLVTLLVIAVQKGMIFNKEEVKNPNVLKLYLTSRDRDTVEQIETNYTIDYTENKTAVFISSGILSKDSLTEIEDVPYDKLIHVNCWSDKYYLTKASKKFSPEEILSNKSTFSCDPLRIGDLDVTYEGNLNQIDNEIKLKITSKNGIATKIGLAFSWTAGIVDVTAPNQVSDCSEGDWVNFTYYNATTKEYNYLPEKYYRCGECENEVCEKTEKCEYVEGKKCKVFGDDLPLRMKSTYDSALYTGKSIQNNETYEIILNVKTLEYKTSMDYVTITIYDRDRRWDSTVNTLLWKTEDNGVDIGGKDKTITIYYG